MHSRKSDVQQCSGYIRDLRSLFTVYAPLRIVHDVMQCQCEQDLGPPMTLGVWLRPCDSRSDDV